MRTQPSALAIILNKIAFMLYGETVYKSFADRLPIEGKENVLDFGCGMGSVAYYTVQKLTNGQLTCLDNSKRWISVCRKTLKRYYNVTYICSDCTALQDDSFDIIYCHFVLHDISDEELQIVIPKLARSLKCGGVLVFREPLNENSKINLIKQLIRQTGLLHESSFVVNVPLMGNSLESIYKKQQ